MTTMRVFTAVLFLGTAISSGAQASSFDVPESMTEAIGPSMMAIGDVLPPASGAQSSFATVQTPIEAAAQALGSDAPALAPSIIAIGEPALDVEKVAAIPADAETKPSPRLAFSPMVIRGGLAGDAFATPAVPDDQ
jgi:hypothetical protein